MPPGLLFKLGDVGPLHPQGAVFAAQHELRWLVRDHRDRAQMD